MNRAKLSVIFAASAAAFVVALPCAHADTYTATVENTPGLIAYYQFNDTNSSVNGYTGTLTSGAAIGAANSGPPLGDDPTNHALTLDGTSGNQLTSSLAGGISSSGSIVGWFNLATLPSTLGRFFYVAGESAGGDDFDVQVQNDNKLYFYTEGGASVSTDALAANTWIFFAATFTANSDRNIYLDGTLAATNTPGNHTDSGDTFTIGYSNVFGGRSFQGSEDEIAIFNTDLTADQVSAIYDSASFTPPPPSVPEPASLSLIGAAGVALLARRKSRR